MTAATEKSPGGAPRAPRSRARLLVLAVIAAVLFTGFCALGTWQVHRLAWKEALIARVDARVHAPPQAAPGPGQWAGLNEANAEYRRVSASGTFLYDRQTLVQAATELGSGYWVMTPLELDGGGIVMVNRGFVLPAWRKTPAARGEPPAPGSVTGLLRMGEAGGAFLRHNDPAAGLWYTRDLPAIAAARGLADVAPYFIDAEAVPGAPRDPASAPVAGLTVLAFPNSHLSYAITWYALALMVIIGALIVVREENRSRRN